MSRADTVLYVHPYNHVVDELVPMGAVALMNRIPAPKLGRYAWELTDADLAAASVVAMDLHWYFSIEAVEWIARDIKRQRPDLPIVLGGITASFYARYLIDTFSIDYVVQGDGEDAFPRLVESLRHGRRPLALPNVWSRSSGPSERRAVRGEEYDANDYATLDWFPTLAEATREAHREYAQTPFWGRMDRYHPYLPLNRGCRFPCNNCFGSYQRDAFGPGQVDRSAGALASALDRIESHGDYRFVSLTAGTEDLARLEGYRVALGRRRRLGAYVMHFCDLPSDRDLETLLDAFERVCIDFTNPEDVPLPLRAKGIDTRAAEDRIFAIARSLDGMERVRVGISFMATTPHPFKDRLRTRSWDRLEIKENSEWTLPRPNHATLESDLPGIPVPSVEREGLTTTELALRDRAKAAQAAQFRSVSREHANYLVARCLAPALHTLLDRSYLQHIDGTPREPVRVTEQAATFLRGYVERYRRWFVTTLPSVEVRLAEVVTDGSSGLANVRSWGRELGEIRVDARYDGMRLSWTGSVGATHVAVYLILPCEDGSVFDTRTVPGLVHWVLATSPSERLVLEGLVSSGQGHIALGDVRVAWDRTQLRPSSPFDAPVPEPRIGPDDLATHELPDRAHAERLARVSDLAVARGLLPGWTSTALPSAARWTGRALAHENGLSVRLYVIAPGPERCMISTPRARVVVQAERGATDEAFFARADVRALLSVLQPILERAARESSR